MARGMRRQSGDLRFGGVSPNTASFAILLARDRFLVFFDVRINSFLNYITALSKVF